MPQIAFLFSIIQVLLWSTCSGASNDVADFETRLYSNVVKTIPGENFFYSPLSIKMCLAMARMGAVNDTALELDTILPSSQDPEKLANEFYDILAKYKNSKILSIANKMYVMKGYRVRRPFYNSLTQKFSAPIASVNFAKSKASADAINRWVKNQVNITDFISEDQLNGDTRLVILNAINFNGEWAHPFDEKSTKEENFILNDTTSFKVKMMAQGGEFKFAHLGSMNAMAVELPYKDSNLSMVIIRPYGGLSELEAKLREIPFTNITDKMRFDDGTVYIPRFKFEFNAEFNKPLNDMGLKRIFSNGAQFDNMLTNSKDLKVSKIVHKAVIEVNEKGTKAAAATDMSMYSRSGAVFIANVPFYFAIVDEKKRKIFEGRINDKFDSFF